ncbi:hypothetical protein HP550_19690 [Cellulomonas humilata]|uniref:Bacterial toxin 4 domain-containing protein n=1 Tax=Cellulomonas humilata TaxID=144055 RepID=A0A7Y6DZT7_9CELL|nr:polymorphic toxin type 4 domain-containing protein [Cellulomonas humilata]NUU19477.1 hypothetical protein [Cellulomonas humilata]
MPSLRAIPPTPDRRPAPRRDTRSAGTPAPAGSAAVLALQRQAGNRATTRMLVPQVQRDNGKGPTPGGGGGTVAEAPAARPDFRLSVPVDRTMDAREFLILFAMHYEGNNIATRDDAEAALAAGTIYWVDDAGNPIPVHEGPEVTEADVAKKYKLATVWAKGLDAMSTDELDQLRTDFYALGNSSEAGINEQTNTYFWEQTGYKVGKKLDPKNDPDDRVMAKDWLRFRAHLTSARAQYMQQPADLRRQLYELVSPEAREFLFRKDGKGTLEPKDFLTALRVADKIAGLTASERAEYLARVTGTTDNWDSFELAIDLYVGEREERGEAGEQREDAKTQLFGADDLYSAYHNYLALRSAALKSPDDNLALELEVTEAYQRLDVLMKQHGFSKLSEVEAWFDPRVAAFEDAFEKEALFVAREMLGRYLHVLYVERERILVPANLDVFYGRLKAAGEDLEPLAEEYPLLRDEDLRDDLAGVLTKSRALSMLLEHSAQREKDIAETRDTLQEDPDLVYGFDALRENAMVAQGVDRGSIYHQIVLRKKEDIESSGLVKSIMLAVIAIAAGLLTGGGGAVAVLGAATAAGIGAFEALQEYRRYEVMHAAHGAGLVSDDPSIAWVIVAAVGAGLDLASVGKAARALLPAIRGTDGFTATGNVVAFTTKYDAIVAATADPAVVKTLADARASIVKAAMARAQEQRAWADILIPASRLNDVLSAAGESFARLVYAVYTSLNVHGRNLAKFLATTQAKQLLGDLATNPAASPESLKALREGFLAALAAQERVVAHARTLGLRDFEIENWFRVWGENPHYPVEKVITEMSEYAAPAAKGASKFRYATDLMTDANSRKVLSEYDLRIAGRGGISKISASTAGPGEKAVTIEGRVLPSIENRNVNAPNFNKTSEKSGSLFTAKELGLKASDWEWAHLWGPGFGDEAAAGLMLAPRQVNQFAQNRGVEGYIRDLAKRVRAEGGEVHVRATATSWGNPTPSGWVPPKGVDFLQTAEYRVTITRPGQDPLEALVKIDVDEPPFAGAKVAVTSDDADELLALTGT